MRNRRGKNQNPRSADGKGGTVGARQGGEKGKAMPVQRTEIVLGTRNHGKISELRSLLKGISLRVLSAYDFPDLPFVVENGGTFRANAEKKAKAIVRGTGRLALADDSGLEVDHLDGRPGVLSSRFCGETAKDRENTRKLLGLMDGVPWERRTARFVCVICTADPKGKTIFVEGTCKGRISFEMRGSHGFGYDPIFVPEGHTRTLAEMNPEEKNQISHRAVALKKIRDTLVRT